VSADDRLPISVVVATYDRPQSCRAAVESVVEQRPAPLEVLVCDDGSPPTAANELRAWCASLPDVEFVGLAPNRGTPAPARNAGIRRARGEWIAFLDDDDLWLPGKLAAQWTHAISGRWDVISGDGIRHGGRRFFSEQTRPSPEPTYADLQSVNPVLLSTALARRGMLLAAGGFPERRRYGGIEDYVLWLALADRGARFLVTEDVLVRYDDIGAERLSSAALRLQLVLAGLAASRWLQAPWERPRATAALRAGVKAGRFALGRVLGR
jgi:glycosyltransferase involved in cell wall biosynthesis